MKLKSLTSKVQRKTRIVFRDFDRFIKPSMLIKELEKRDISKSDMRRTNEEWFEEVYVQRTEETKEKIDKSKFEVGKIYTFDYHNPKYKKELDFYNAVPVMLCLGYIKTSTGKLNPYGINLTFIPPQIRLKILDIIWEKFKTSVIKPNIIKLENEQFNLAKLPTDYYILKKLIQDSGFEFAVRSYIKTRIKNEPRIISFDDCWRLVTFSSKYLQKMNSAKIYYLYKTALNEQYKIGYQRKEKVKIKTTSIRDLKKIISEKEKQQSVL